MKIVLLKLEIAPSFEDGFVLTLMENTDREKTTYLLRYEEVRLRSRSPVESIGQEFSLSEDIKVTNEEAENILRILRQASISVVPGYRLGMDGIMYKLTVSSGLNEGHYKWWERIPEGWEVLAKIADALLRLVDKPAIRS
jgi:hypothetical protein